MMVIGVSATPKPSARWPIRSILIPGQHRGRPWPDRELQLQADHEHTYGQCCKQDSAYDRFLWPKLMARRAGQDDEHNRRENQPQLRDDQPEEHDASQYSQRRSPLPRGNSAALQPESAEREGPAEYDQED